MWSERSSVGPIDDGGAVPFEFLDGTIHDTEVEGFSGGPLILAAFEIAVPEIHEISAMSTEFVLSLGLIVIDFVSQGIEAESFDTNISLAE